MTDGELAVHAVRANETEVAARAWLGVSDLSERDMAQATLRQAVALRKVVEKWIVLRSLRSQRQDDSVGV